MEGLGAVLTKAQKARKRLEMAKARVTTEPPTFEAKPAEWRLEA